MKIVDRTLIFALIRPFAFCVASFFFLWIIYDLFDNLGDFIEHKAPLVQILKFYAVQLPEVAQLVLPVSFFFALLFVLTNMSHHRELDGLQSGGISLSRITAPVFVLALIVAAFQYFLFIDLTPRASQRVRDTMNEIRGGSSGSGVFREVIYEHSPTGVMWFAQKVDVLTRRAIQVEIWIPDPVTRRDSQKIFAGQAVYKDAAWELLRCRIVHFDPDGHTRIEDLDSMQANFLNVTPHQMIAALRRPEHLRWDELRDFIFYNPHPSETRMAPFRTEYYYRMAYPLISPVLFLFAVALAITSNRQNRAAPLFKCLVALFALLIWMNFSLALGNGMRIPAWLAACNPIVVFAALGLYLYGDRVGWNWIIRHRLLGRARAV